jgi:hypothetical protein
MTGQVTSQRGTTRARWMGPIAVFAVTLPPLYGLWLSQGTPMEEGFMLTFPEMVLDGRVPNRDFLHLYGPGSLWVLAAVFAVFGAGLAAERVVGYLQHLGVAFGVYRLLRPWGPWVATGGACIAAVVVLTPSGLSAMAWVGGVAVALWALGAAIESVEAEPGSSRRQRQAIVAGLLAGAALLYRLDLVLALGASGLIVWLHVDRAARRRLLTGLVAGCSPYVVHVVIAGPRAAFEGLVLEPIFDLRGGRRLPIPPSTSRFDGFLQGAGALDQAPWPLPAPSGPRQLWLWFFALLLVGAVLLAAGVVARRRTGQCRLLVIAVFSVGLFPQALQRPDSTHLAWVGCVAFAMLPAAVIELWRARLPRPVPAAHPAPAGWRAGIAAVAVPAVLLVVVAPYFTYRSYAEATAQSLGHRRSERTIEHHGRRFPYKRHDAVAAVNEMLPVVDAVTKPGDRLIVGPGDLRKTPYSEAFLYHLLPDLVPGTRFIEMDPGVANAGDSGLAEEVAQADVVILSTIRDDWNEPNDSLRFGSDEPNEVLAREFCLEESFGIDPFDPDRGLYELYLRC